MTRRLEDLTPDERRRVLAELARLAPCWCGSGKRYMRCHEREDVRLDALFPSRRPSDVSPASASPVGASVFPRRAT